MGISKSDLHWGKRNKVMLYIYSARKNKGMEIKLVKVFNFFSKLSLNTKVGNLLKFINELSNIIVPNYSILFIQHTLTSFMRW